MALSIVITDDHDIIRAGIKNIISDQINYTVVAEARDGEEALVKVKEHKPDILLLDITMPKLSGLDVIEQVHAISPKTKVLVISVHKAHIYAMKAFQAGAKGYLNKANAGEELLPALTKITSGEVYLTASISSYLVKKALNKSTKMESKESLLTLREQEVLRLVAEGKTAKEVAGTLFISRRTVENYKNTLLKKLSLHKTSDLIKYAIRHKIVEIGDEEY